METWLPVPGYEGSYEVSDAGRVRSLLRGVRILKPGTSGGKGKVGYPMVIFVPRKARYVHHLVAEAFIGPRPQGQVVRHLDDNPFNNTPGNLAYGTTAQNNRDMSLHGRHWKGREQRCSKGHPFDYWNGRQRVCRRCRAAAVAAFNERNPGYAAALKRKRRQKRRAAEAANNQGHFLPSTGP
jgi:hypothetical protein